MALGETTVERTERVESDRRARKRMLVIVNPYATTVSARLKNLVVYALQGRYEVEAVDTEAREHATELCREAAAEGYDVVVAFGGDGTVNEAANGLVGSDTPLTCLPGGSTNVACRTLGIPNDVVDATEHLLRMADDFHPRRIDLGRVNGRHFFFGSGVGLDASIVERVDRHPYRKARFGEWYYTYAGIVTFIGRYLVRPPRVRVEVEGQTLEAVTVVVQNSDPFTYFGRHPIRLGRDVELDSGTLSLTLLRRATPFQLPTLMPRILSGRPDAVAGHRQVETFEGLEDARVVAIDDRPFPLEVDGDHIGDVTEAAYGLSPGALAVVA